MTRRLGGEIPFDVDVPFDVANEDTDDESDMFLFVGGERSWS